MSVANKLLQAAAGNAGADPVYVDDVFSTYLYDGEGKNAFIENNIALSNTTDGGSAYFPSGNQQGSADQYPIQLSSNITLSGNFTIEMWIKRDGTSTAGECILSPDYGNSGGNIQIGVNKPTDTTAPDALYIYDGTKRNGSTTNTVPHKAWTHIAYSRNGSTVYFWVNGVAAGTVSTSYSFVINTIGALGGYGAGPIGYISNLRISNNARYTSAFTAPTSALSSDSNTLLLILQGASPFTDQSGNKTLTVASTTESSTEGPFDSGSGGHGGMVVLKTRDAASGESWITTDTERGAGKYLMWHNTDAQSTTANVAVQSFTSSGFGLTGSESSTNNSALRYVSYTFRKQAKFFDVVTYTGNSTSGRTVSHNLGSVPGMIIVKRTSSSGYDWQVYHRANTANPETDYLVLNSQSATADNDSRWNDTAPTSTEFTLGNSSYVNGSGATYVAYLFAHDEQEFGENSDEAIIKCGGYTGNNSNTGPTIDVGFEPQWVMIRNTGATSNWLIYDSMRGLVFGGSEPFLRANATSDEDSTTDRIQLTPTGFQVLTTSANVNSNNDFIYMAIRRSHKPASEFAATDLFAIDTKGGTSPTPPSFVSGFPVDLAFNKNVSGTGTGAIAARLMQDKRLYWASSSAQQSNTDIGAFDYQNGYRDSTAVTSSAYSWMWRRAKGYFDVVAYEGNGTNGHTIKHNLGVAPEILIVKSRTLTGDWRVNLYNVLNDTKGALLNDNGGVFNDTSNWNSYYPTATDFKVGSQNAVNANGHDYIAFLFASVAGISKIGTFSRTQGNTTDVDCGFSSGARFVLIKRTNTSGSWVMWDSVRGIVAGNEPYIALNSNNAQITNQDYIDPLSSGFSIQSGIATGDWLFYAIA